MSNKRIGSRFEKEFAAILAKHWFWVHLFQDNRNGQPCDVIAAKDGYTYLFDCKNCEKDFFALSRVEENQINAMQLWEATGNGKGMFAIRFPNEEIYLVEHDKCRELIQANFKRINATVCRTRGTLFKDWLQRFEMEEGQHGNHHWV